MRIDIGYATAHDRVRALHGRPFRWDCVDCGGIGQEWSYVGDPLDERIEIGYRGDLFRFSPHPVYYEPRCRRCHRAYDRRKTSA